MSYHISIILGVWLFINSIFLIRNGWLMVVYQKPIIFFPTKVGYQIARLIKGPREANRLLREFTRPEKTRVDGILIIIGAVMCLFMGVLSLLDAITKIMK